MSRAAALETHLPPLYREGELLRAFTALWGVQLDMLDEASVSVQRAHGFDTTHDLDEAAALAALLDIVPEEFHATLGEFRGWVHALTAARLHAGAVTREALRILVDTYAQAFQRSARIEVVPPIASWRDGPDGQGAALVENPPRLRSARLPATGGWEPLARVEVTNAGIDPAPWAMVLTGLPGGAEYAPFVANLTTGYALVFRGEVGVGARLTIAPSATDRTVLAADLDGQDVTGHLDVYTALERGVGGPGSPASEPTAPLLARGRNELWFLPLAHYDTPGLDRFLLALADDTMRAGRFDESAYDKALFVQHAAVSAWVAWVEQEPASVEIHLPAAILRTESGAAGAGTAARDRLETGLDAAVDATAGAGIATDVVLRRFAERQPGQARLTAMFPRTLRETGPTGADRLAEAGGLFDVTDFDDSVLR